MEIKSSDFIYIINYLIDYKYIDSDFKKELLNKENYDTTLEYVQSNSIEFEQKFYSVMNAFIYSNIQETNYEIDDNIVTRIANVTKIGEKYFYSVTGVYDDKIEYFIEVIPENITIQSFKFPTGNFTDDTLSERLIK